MHLLKKLTSNESDPRHERADPRCHAFTILEGVKPFWVKHPHWLGRTVGQELTHERGNQNGPTPSTVRGLLSVLGAHVYTGFLWWKTSLKKQFRLKIQFCYHFFTYIWHNHFYNAFHVIFGAQQSQSPFSCMENDCLTHNVFMCSAFYS